MQFKAIFTALVAAAGVSAESLTALINSEPSLSMLAGFLAAYPSVAGTLANATGVTLFAPNNAAIKAVAKTLVNATVAEVEALLSYHVVPERLLSTDFSTTPLFPATLLNDNAYDLVAGGQVIELVLVGGAATVISGLDSESKVVKANLRYTGGIVHIIDKVLTIPPPPSAILPPANLTDLLGAVVATNLTAALDSTAEITIFAPTNPAFHAIGSAAATLTTLQLARLVEYHVVVGHALYSSDIVTGYYPTLLGREVLIEIAGEAVFVNGARVINPNILTSNGVLHVIDAVLNPLNVSAPFNSSKPVVQFAGASSASLPPALTKGLPPASSTISALVATIESVLAVPTSKA